MVRTSPVAGGPARERVSAPQTIHPKEFTIQALGARKVPTPYAACRYVADDERTLFDTTVRAGGVIAHGPNGSAPLAFELAGPRELIYFDPSKTRCGVVTCGGLCPGINAVIRAITLQLWHSYGVRNILGFKYGFEGLMPAYGHDAVRLDPNSVANVHQHGGSILGSSRGPQPADELVDALERLNIQALFCIGGDGTFRGALALHEEIQKRNLKMAVVAVPKTIDNDIPYTARTFGFETAYAIAADAIQAAHVEATGAPNGIGLLKLMGRHAGFIATHAVLANRDANFVLIPEVEFELGGTNGFLPHLMRRLRDRGHAVIVVAEGAGQHLLEDDTDEGTDASGNTRLKDIGVFLRDRISQYLNALGMPFTLKYIDPSYLIRSAPARPSDTLFAGVLGQAAAHAGMAGKTGMFVGYWNDQFMHVPISAGVSTAKQVDPNSNFWQSVLECTGQPRKMVNDGDGPDGHDAPLLMEVPSLV